MTLRDIKRLDGTLAQLKILGLTDIVRIKIHDFPLPFVMAPPFGTAVRWKMGERAINSFYRRSSGENKSEREVRLDYLTAWQLEVLCEEWLRKNGHLQFKVFHTGKFLKDFDIVGIDKQGRSLYAQVKYSASSKDVEKFFRTVKGFEKDKVHGSKLFFFAKESDLVSMKSKAEGIELVSIEDVFESFKSEKRFLEYLTYGQS